VRAPGPKARTDVAKTEELIEEKQEEHKRKSTEEAKTIDEPSPQRWGKRVSVM